MASVEDFMKGLKKMKGAMLERFDPYQQSNLIKIKSPSWNWMFGHGHGLPYGQSIMLWAEAKSGKSLMSYAMIGACHQDDPEYIVIKFDTEFRDDAQLTEESAALWGIDLKRLLVIQTNHPTEIFDQIQNDVLAMVQKGAKIKLVIIDSINGIQGLQDANAESVGDNQMADHARTTKKGLKRILSVWKRNRIALVVCTHATAEMDPWEQKRNGKSKASANYGVRHTCEYFVNLERVLSADGKTDELGNAFIDESRKGMDDKGEKTGHKIRFWMQDSTVGVQDRVGELTFDYRRGIINQHEECFTLGINWGIIKRPNNRTYEFEGQTYNGKPAMLTALMNSAEMQQRICDLLLEEEKTYIPNYAQTGKKDEAAEAFDE